MIMVPLDGSRFAEQALPLALTLARRAQARLHLVRVRPSLPLGPDGTEEEQYLVNLARQLETELPDRITHRVLTNEFGPLVYPPPPADSVADVLARYSEESDVDLVVMTTHGRGGLRRAWLGSAADAVVRLAARPVLLIRPEDEAFSVAAAADRGIHHIVVPLDGSESAEHVLPYARQIGSLFAARFTLLRSVSPLTWDITAEQYGAYPPPQFPVYSRAAAEQYVEQLAAGLRQNEVAATGVVVDGPSVASAILDYAATHGADLIALTTAGAGGIRRLLLGSVADKIVRSGEVAVLVCNVQHEHARTEPALGAAGSVETS
jgi:nucleotide-binding universal stress UspA family protein